MPDLMTVITLTATTIISAAAATVGILNLRHAAHSKSRSDARRRYRLRESARRAELAILKEPQPVIRKPLRLDLEREHTLSQRVHFVEMLIHSDIYRLTRDEQTFFLELFQSAIAKAAGRKLQNTGRYDPVHVKMHEYLTGKAGLANVKTAIDHALFWRSQEAQSTKKELKSVQLRYFESGSRL